MVEPPGVVTSTYPVQPVYQAALGPPARVGFEEHLQKQIARRRAAPARAALAGQANELALAHALWNLDLQAALVPRKRAVASLMRALQRERALGAQVGIREIKLNACVVVVAACSAWLLRAVVAVGRPGGPTAKRARPTARLCAPAKQLVKKIAVIIGRAALRATAACAVGELKPRIPVGWWPKVLPGLGVGLLGQAVVGCAFFRV